MRSFSLFCFLFLIFGISAHASYISLNTSLSSKVEGRTLKVAAMSVNKGDEPAYNVRAEFKVGGKVILAEKRSELPVDASYQARASIPLSAAKPGSYPLILIMHYTDANQYPFSALSAQTFVLGKESPSPLFGQVKSTTFSKEGKLRFKLKNLGDKEIAARTYLVTPRELTANEQKLELAVGPKSEQSAGFSVKNFSALSGSTYQIFAVSEFEDGGTHYTSIAPGTIKIVEDKVFLGLNQNLLMIALAALVIIFVCAQFIKREK